MGPYQWGNPTIQYLDLENRVAGAGPDWIYLSLQLGSLYTSMNVDTQEEHSQMVLAIKFVTAPPHSSFYSTTHCHIESGVINYNKLTPITCELDTTNNQFIIRNIGKINSQYIKIYYYAYTINA